MIKFVKAARMWCVTKISKNKDKIHQEQTWHSDKKEAQREDSKDN